MLLLSGFNGSYWLSYAKYFKFKVRKLILLFFTVIFAFENEAAHLIGGEMSYECLGNDQYLLNLDLYRDCDQDPNCENCANNFDEQTYFSIFDANNVLIDTFFISIDIVLDEEDVVPTTPFCADYIPQVCVKRATGYQVVLDLPPLPGGYKLVFQRCCRNATITNILVPGETGSTYELIIPDESLAVCNSSPTFDNFPPIIICAGYPLIFDHSATDIDGDELLYSLCTPNSGASNLDPAPQIASNPPYQGISWANGYGINDQIGGTPAMTIDPVTGLLEGFPDQIGQFVVGICVEEYRDGNLLSTSIRDFQFNITDCNIASAAIFSDDISIEGEYILNDCGSYEVTFVNESLGGDTYFWDLGDPTNPLDQTNAENPTYLYPDTGVYEVLLVVNPSLPCTDTANIVLNLFPLLTPNFSYDADCSSQPVEFTDLSTSDFGNVTDYTWNFGDGNSSNDQNPSHLYDEGGNYNVSLTVFTDLGCEEVYEEEIYVLPTPEAFYFNSALCLDAQPISFIDSSDINIGNIVSWEWDFGDMNNSVLQNPEHTFAGAGDYDIVLTVTSDEGCIGELNQTITIFEIIETDAGIDLEICDGESIQLVANSNITNSTYLWTPNSPDIINDATVQNPTVTPNETTTFTLVNTDANGCEDTDQIEVAVFLAPESEAGESVNLCQGASVQLNGSAFDPNGGNANLTYEWTPNSSIDNQTILNPTVNPIVPTLYFLTVTETEHNCVASDSVQVEVILPFTTEIKPDTIVCESSSFQLWATGGDTYLWEPAGPLNDPTSATPTATLNENTTFTVTASNECFDDVASISIEVLPAPNVDAGPNFELPIGETVQLEGFSEFNNYNWAPSEGLSDVSISSPIAQPLNTTVYSLTATSPNGCTAIDTMRVDVTKIFKLVIPNAFSPNGDGRNDQIGLHTKGIRELEIFRIYNRWGQMVFETNDLQGRWDGSFKDIPQELGVFVYYAVGITYEGNEFFEKGNITLLR